MLTSAKQHHFVQLQEIRCGYIEVWVCKGVGVYIP